MDLIPKYFFKNSFDDIFDFPVLKNNNFMKTDVSTKDGNYVFEVDIPGFKKDEINVNYNRGYLTIKAHKEENNNDEDNKQYIRKERFYGEYERSFYVGEIDESQIKAAYDNGILNVVVPMESENKKNQRTIEIQ